MRRPSFAGWVCLSLALGLAACGSRAVPGASDTADAGEPAVAVRAEGVEVRLYRGGELKLEARAARLKLDETQHGFEVEGGVQGTLAPQVGAERWP